MNFLQYTAIANKPQADKLIVDATGYMPRSTNETYYYLARIAKETGEKGMAKILEFHPDYNMFKDFFNNASATKAITSNSDSELNITTLNATGNEDPLQKTNNTVDKEISDTDKKFMFSTNMMLLGAATLISLAVILRK